MLPAMRLDPQASAFLAAVAELNSPKYEDLPADEGREIFAKSLRFFWQRAGSCFATRYRGAKWPPNCASTAQPVKVHNRV